MRRPLLLSLSVLLVALFASALAAQRAPSRDANAAVGSAEVRALPGLRPDENLLFNGWGLTPAGEQVPISDLPLKMVPSPDGATLLVASGGFNDTGVSVIDLRGKARTQFVPMPRCWNGLAFSRDGSRVFVTTGSGGQIRSFRFSAGKLTDEKTVSPDPAATTPFLAGIAVHPETGKLYVCCENAHEIWVVDPETLLREGTAPRTGPYPHSLAFGADRRHLYVSNWGGRSVTVIDTRSALPVREFSVGLRPNDMALASDGRLFVACSGDNTVHVIQTRALEQEALPADPTRRPPEGVREILSTSLYPQSPEGSTPDAVAVSPDGKRLYVANADNNAVLVADITEPATTRVEGFVPVGWYPSALAVDPSSGALLVGNGKGLRSRPNGIPPAAGAPPRSSTFTYTGRLLAGSLSVIPRPGESELATYTQQVRRNSPYTPETLRRAPTASGGVVPERPGDPCPIKYVLYIIKENRTYDQVFGNFRDASGRRVGNGDPNLVWFDADVAPNHHQLARDYVLLDNLYCNGEVSVDGHSWCDAAMATDFNERRWMMSYSGHGTLPGNDEMETPMAGYLWDLCRRHGVSFKCYGEGSSEVPNINRGTWSGGRDMQRVDGWIQDLKAAETTGDLPRFAIMSLGEDHTSGARPGSPTPEASVASNDIGLGKIVAAASRSRFWKQMAIFVIEDDAQNGPDHVDAHRTVGLVISPYVRRATVDSTLYTTASMIRTMELILGLPPLTQYDAGATPMFRCFGKRADAREYALLQPKVDVNKLNTPATPGAAASARMDFSEYDRAPEDELNRILWRLRKGTVAYAAPIHRAVFTR